ncbi:ras guanine nucleotide exchange factor domain-containing protein [Pisolithus croceorrhizus]|nr:ras guanine nucleotide exchange factor domain-containing protein [Pisolithus croceorrhizus]KAI6166726.1 ras guanine nucleotide exchange factor domain-containing protein [Pisolithus thermaeus]
MSTSRLHINTNVHRGITLASQQRSAGLSDTPPQTLQPRNRTRARSGSLASTSSSLSVESPAPSSSASSSSLHLPHPAQEPEDAHVAVSNPPSPSADETMRAQPAASEFVLALHDFAPQQQNATCLSFRAGQLIQVLNKDSSGWWDGELDGQRGWFPSNYVCTDYLPHTQRQKMRHGHTISSLSAMSWATTPSRGSSRKDHRPLVTETLGSDITSYCPPLMVNLLHSLSLLQSAVRSNRIAHFQPATACIISCVRSILSVMECLHRDAPLLKQFPLLAAERKHVLSGLAVLVSQARKASDEGDDEDVRDTEIEGMLKLGGQVFSQVRRFVAVAVQCGIELPEKAQVSQCSDSNATTLEVGASPAEIFEPPDFRSQRRFATYRESDSSLVPLLSHRAARSHSKRDQYEPYDRATSSRHKPGVSVSSTSSSSSLSSAESPKPVLNPDFPTGPTTSAEILEALKHTNDGYLSVVSAFIGHAFSHSRSSHASSTGHMYDLVREIVEMAFRLVTIVEVVARHPSIPPHKVNSLRLAKEALYNVTTSLAESVRQLTMPLPPGVTDDTERDSLVRSATEAHKAGADCFSVIKSCLSRTSSQQQFVIELPAMLRPKPGPSTMAEFPSRVAAPPLSNLCRGPVDEDVTIHPPTQPVHPPQLMDQNQETSSDSSDVTSLTKSLDGSQDTALTSLDEQSLEEGSGTNLGVLADTASSSCVQLADNVDAFHRRTPDTLVDDVGGDEASLITLEVKRKHLGHNLDVIYNSDGHLVAASLDALVEKMTPQDSIVDAAFSAVFFLTFRLFCSPVELVHAIIDRYNVVPPPNMSKDDALAWERYKEKPIRLRVSNFVKTWLELYWRSGVDDPALPHLATFIREALQPYFPGPCQRILTLIDIRRDANSEVISPKSERARDPGMSINPPTFSPSEIPRPTMTKTLLAALRSKHFESVSVTDFDALELARQLTIMECQLYCAIQPEEILETGQEGAKPPIHVKAVSSLSTVITGWVAENILNEHDLKKRTTLVKFFIKLADRCTFLNNFSTPRSILAALDSSTVSRLHQTWSSVPQKNKGQLESLRRLADHSRNYHEYRSRLRNTAPPAVPFLGLYLTDVTFCREGNPSYRDGPSGKKLLNFNKYHKLARIVQDMQRFQVPYNLKQIPEVQEYLSVAFENSKHHGDLEDLYRRSLLVEPKQPADTLPMGDMRHLFNWATRSQAQQPTSA